LLGGLFATAGITALYERLREADSILALCGFLFVLVGAIGSIIHGGFDLSNALHPPANLNTDLPNPIDPRGLLTFGLAGIGLFVFSGLVMRSGSLSRTSAISVISQLFL